MQSELLKLAAALDPKDVRHEAQTVNGDRALVFFSVDPAAVQQRLDDVLTPAGWQDEYQQEGEGSIVVCVLRCKIGGEWIAKTDLAGSGGSGTSEEKLIRAHHKALSRAAAKFGVARYLSMAAAQWVAYDPAEQKIVGEVTIPPCPKPPMADEPAKRPVVASAFMALATKAQVIELHKLIKQHTKGKTWKSTLHGCGVWAPDGWKEPTNAAELETATSWLKDADATKMIERIKVSIK